MSQASFVDVQSVLKDVIKEEPLNHEYIGELTGNTESNWQFKLEVEDCNAEDLHHEVDIKEEVSFEPCVNQLETCYPEIRRAVKRKLSCGLSEDELISVVSKKPALWNPSHNDYKSENFLSLWEDVAQELGVSGEGPACRAKWDNIKEQYKNLKRSDENRRLLEKWKCADKLSFLDPYLSSLVFDYGKSSSCKRLKADFLEGTNVAIPDVSSCLSSVTEQRRNRKLSNDSITTFFLSIENTVRKLPPDLQIQAKRNIFEVITNCELMAIKRNSA